MLIAKPPAAAVVEVGGIGFNVVVPLTTWEKLGPSGHETQLFTYLHVREDVLQLYGFDSTSDRDMFLTLIGVNGVGPKLALTLLSRFRSDELAEVVSSNDVRRLTAVQGVGKKTAERLIVELKDRVSGRGASTPVGGGGGAPSLASEAVAALETLGYSLQQADAAVRKAKQGLGESATIEELIRQALKG